MRNICRYIVLIALIAGGCAASQDKQAFNEPIVDVRFTTNPQGVFALAPYYDPVYLKDVLGHPVSTEDIEAFFRTNRKYSFGSTISYYGADNTSLDRIHEIAERIRKAACAAGVQKVTLEVCIQGTAAVISDK